MTNLISKKIRQNIIQKLRKNGIKWKGDLTDADFLSRIYDLDSMESYDYRYENAKGDITQHRYWNLDWGEDWVYDDKRFDLVECSDREFLNFICETIHPVVRYDTSARKAIQEMYNEELRAAGYTIVEKDTRFGTSYYEAEVIGPTMTPGIEDLRVTAERFGSNYLKKQIPKMVAAIDKDPDLAIGTAKEVIETSCKALLEKNEVKIADNIKMNELVHSSAKIINETLKTDNDEELALIIKKMFGSLETLAQSIYELRNLTGSGHGKDLNHSPVASELAALAVNSAVSVSIFVLNFC